VHHKKIVACRRIVRAKRADQVIGRFSTTTQGLINLADLHQAAKISHGAMEATGVHWKPLWHILYGGYELTLANAAHIQKVPGRKSDVNDAT
jgi:transposase